MTPRMFSLQFRVIVGVTGLPVREFAGRAI